MTFDFVTSHPHTSPSEDSYLQDLGHVDFQFTGALISPSNKRDSDLKTSLKTSLLAAHIERAEKHLKAGNYDAACLELEAAAELFLTYKHKIRSSFNHSIAHLTTLGCRATPPHPIALSLTRLRRELIA